MSQFYKEYEPKPEDVIRQSNEEYLKQIEQELREEKKIPQSMNFKNVIFNRFYLELIAYFVILMFGVIINAFAYTNQLEYMTQIGIGVFSTVLVCFMMYCLGYMSAKKREGIRKYTAPFYILLIFGIVTIIRTIFAMLGWENGIATLFIYANNLFIQSCQIIFSWLTLNVDIGYLYVIITVLMIALGVRKNIVKERKNRG